MSELRFKDITDSLAEGYDPNLREELFTRLEKLNTDDDALRGVQLFVQKHGRDYELMKSTFKSFYQILEAKEKQNKKINLSWIKYAAVFAIVIGLSFYYFGNRGIDLTAYEYEEIGLPVLMGSDQNIDFNNGMSAFKMKDYHKAYDLFSNCLESDTVIYYKSVCLYQLKKYPDAISGFNQIKYPSVFNEKAHYLKSLAFIHNNEPDKALGILVGLASSSNPFNVKANALFESISKDSIPKEFKRTQ